MAVWELAALCRKEMDIMFIITEEQYREISGLLSKHCCPCIGKNWNCAEVECDVQFIYEILLEHVERDDTKPDGEKTDLDLIAKECSINLVDDSLPFRE